MRWHEKCDFEDSIRAKGVDFQISVIGAALRLGNRPFWYLGDNAKVVRQPAVPSRAMWSIPMTVLQIWPMLYT